MDLHHSYKKKRVVGFYDVTERDFILYSGIMEAFFEEFFLKEKRK